MLKRFNQTFWLRGVDEVIRRFARRLRKNDSGASLVEFAFVASILFALVFGIIEFGWYLYGHIAVTSAAREGARVAILKDATDVDVVEAVHRHTLALNSNPAVIINGDVVSGSINGEENEDNGEPGNDNGENGDTGNNNNGNNNRTVTVKVIGTLRPLSGFVLSGTYQLQAESSMYEEF